MSRCLRGCDDDRNTFTFSKRLATFHEAKNYCKLSRGTLVQKLSKSSYAALLQCCPGHREYWIGLQNVGASKCSKKKGFQWIGSKTCTDGSPFKLNLQPVNNNECKAVVIIGSHSANNNQNLPITRVQNCNSTNIYYICQTAKQNRNPSTITTTKLTTKIISSESSTSKTKTSPTIFSTSTSNETKISNVFLTGKTSSDSVVNVWMIAGLLTVCFLLLFLAASFLYRRQSKKFLSKKKKNFHLKKKTSDPINESNQTKIDETYCKLVFVIVYK